MSLTDVVRIIGSLASLGKVLKDEYTLLSGLSDKVEEARKELELIQAYLKDADAKAADTASGGHAVKEWVKQVRETAFSLDDAVGFFLRKLARVRAEHKAAVAHPIMVMHKHLFSSEIDEIIKTIRRLNEQRQNLDLSPSDGEQQHHLDHRHGSLSLKDEELVGVNGTKERLHSWLLEGEPTRTVITLFGEGGLGKTSIAWNVYKKHKDVEKSFDCYAWITVTRSLKVEDLLKTVLEKLYENERNTYVAKEKSDIVGLGKELLEYLHGRRYMVVFDNVQMTEFWGDVHFAFPDNRDKVKRSRIMITSRDEGVGKFCRGYVPTHIREVKPLRSDDALKLFHRRTFQCDPQDCPEEFKKLSQDFVKRCQGVPLAIVALSCLLLSQGKMVSTWEETYSSLRSKFKSNPHLKSYEIVLSESYHDLPYHLKPCLLYFGLFPESHVVSCVKLVRLWVAEGFVNIESDQDQTLEEAAQDYLTELIHRSLVKVSYADADGTVRSCRVHDLMHIFIMKKCEESSFGQAVVKGPEAFRFHKWTRRLSIQDDDFPKTDKNYSRVRSCVVCDVEQLPESTLNLFLSCFKLLVALDLEGASLDHLPDAVAKLINLKYLSVRKTKIVSIPKFIGKLQLLETLNLRDTGVRELPVEINKLVKLRHLLSDSHYSIEQFGNLNEGVKLKEGIGGLTALQSLVALDATNSGDCVIREMENLKRMRRLGIANLREGSGSLVCDAIKNMPHLDSLLIKATGEDQVLELQSLADPPLRLQYLFLDGRLQGLPGWIFRLKNLVMLRLKWSRLAQDPLPLLKDLPELLQLYLQSSCEGEELHFKEGWFQKLKELRLRNFDGLRALKIDEGALPNLEELWLGPCPQMEAVPNDVQNLKALKHLFLRMPSNFVDDISALLKRNNQKTTLYIFSTHTSRWQVKV